MIKNAHIEQASTTEWRSMDSSHQIRRPLIAITSDLMVRNDRLTAFSTMTYSSAVLRAGAIPVILPPIPSDLTQLIEHFDAFILTGGDDPQTESFGVPTHPAAVRVLEDRQSFETNLLNLLNDHPQVPVLGICLGMQMMALCNGGTLNQHLPDTHATHSAHWEHEHTIESIDQSVLKSGAVYSKHRQAVEDPGKYRVLATSSDNIIEAIDDPDRAFTLGVQWHPERTTNDQLGQHIINQLVDAARAHTNSN